jgi:hypothetical protein
VASVPTINSLSVASGLPTNNAACEYSDIACASCSACAWETYKCGTEQNAASTGTCTGVAALASAAPRSFGRRDVLAAATLAVALSLAS